MQGNTLNLHTILYNLDLWDWVYRSDIEIVQM